MHDPRVLNAQVSRIFLSADMKTCRVMVTVDGSAEDQQAALQALAGAAQFIRQELSIQLNLKYTPRLFFIPEDNDR
jgi:ribosome-binding factor A